jgi:hypothetical protein
MKRMQLGMDPREVKVSGNVVALLGLTKTVPHLLQPHQPCVIVFIEGCVMSHLVMFVGGCRDDRQYVVNLDNAGLFQVIQSTLDYASPRSVPFYTNNFDLFCVFADRTTTTAYQAGVGV